MINKLPWRILLSCIGVFAAAVGVFWWWKQPVPLLSPVSSLTTFEFLPEPVASNTLEPSKVVYGFLPYWNTAKAQLQPELTHLGYFSLGLANNGTLLTKTADGGEPGYQKLQSDQVLELLSSIKKNGGKAEIVITQFDNDTIVAFLNSPTAHQNFLSSLDSVLLAYPFEGINIDIEYTGEVSDRLRSNFVTFMKELREHVNKKYGHLNISVDIFASGANGGQIWDVQALTPHVDYFVVMAYDFHRRSSPQAGPVAPLFGGKKLWDSDISQHLRDLLLLVPKEKILLGIPFYGYEWQTTSNSAQAFTFPDTGSTASIERVTELLAQKKELNVVEHWNDAALSPYLTYRKNGQQFVIYFENSRSLSYKLDFVNQLHLGGIAIWALGYEGPSRELWDVIHHKFELSK
jgi:spore germination protein YaaH